MRTTRSSSRQLCVCVWGVCLGACWDTPPGVGLETPLGVGLETPPRCGPGDHPRCGTGDPPGCGPGDTPSPQVWDWRHPLPPGVGLETHPPSQTPQPPHLGVGLETPPPARPSSSLLCVGLETCKACWDTHPLETCKACWDTTPPVNRMTDRHV